MRLADRILWRDLPIWAMDSDRFDSALDSSFLIEPNSGRDWAGLALPTRSTGLSIRFPRSTSIPATNVSSGTCAASSIVGPNSISPGVRSRWPPAGRLP